MLGQCIKKTVLLQEMQFFHCTFTVTICSAYSTYNEEQIKWPTCSFMKQTRGTLRYQKGPKTPRAPLNFCMSISTAIELRLQTVTK